jgi:ABC-type amino acid transport substrate-binding protein
MAVSKGVMSAILIVVLIGAFAAGFFVRPYIWSEEKPEEEPPKTIWETIQERGVIKIGTSPDWPPYEYLNLTVTPPEIIGFEIELMEMVAEQLNLTVDWKDMDFDLIILDVQDKAIDMGISGFSIKPDRLEVVQYTMHHSITEGQIIMLESTRDALGITEIGSVEELDSLRLDSKKLECGAQSGTTQQKELQDEAPDTLVTYSDYIDALADMKRGAIDCVYAETPVTSWWILEAAQAVPPEEPIVVIFRRPYWPVAFVAHLDADIFVAKINGALAEIIAEGQLDELKAKWKCD